MNKYLICSTVAWFVSCTEPNRPNSPNADVTDRPNISKEDGNLEKPGKSDAVELEKNIRSIYQDTRGNYWFGTHDAGVYRYDGRVLTHFAEKEGLSSDQVLVIQEDQSGNLWFGTGGFQISRFDGQIFRTYTPQADLKPDSRHGNKWAIAPDDLWFYAGAGVYRYNGDAVLSLTFPQAVLDSKAEFQSNRLSSYAAYSTLIDHKGNLWVGTQTMGVCRYDGKSFTWFTEKGLAGPAVRALFEDTKGNLWFGNNGYGLFRYDGKSLSNFTAENGLSNDAFIQSNTPGPGTLARVMSINEDDAGTLWIGTVDAGVWRYDGNELNNYTTKDGLTSDCINVIYKDKKGAMLFGTATGVFVFNGVSFTKFEVK